MYSEYTKYIIVCNYIYHYIICDCPLDIWMEFIFVLSDAVTSMATKLILGTTFHILLKAVSLRSRLGDVVLALMWVHSTSGWNPKSCSKSIEKLWLPWGVIVVFGMCQSGSATLQANHAIASLAKPSLQKLWNWIFRHLKYWPWMWLLLDAFTGWWFQPFQPSEKY